MREVDGEREIADPEGITDYIFENAGRSPSLRKLLKVNKEKIARHIEETGEVPPGVKAVQERAVPGTNVTRLDIVHGPGVLPKDDD
jgi:hypothetical protein